MIQLLLLVSLAAAPALVSALAHPRRPVWSSQAQDISLRTARSWKTRVLWVDVRPAEQYLLDRIPGALPLNMRQWEQLIPHVRAAAADKHIVIYGQDRPDDQVRQVAERLRREAPGIEHVHILRRGFSAWNAELR